MRPVTNSLRCLCFATGGARGPEGPWAQVPASSSVLRKNWNTMCKMGMRRDNKEALCGLRTPYREEPMWVEPEYFWSDWTLRRFRRAAWTRPVPGALYWSARPNHGTLQLHNNNVLSDPRQMEVYCDYITCRVTYLFRVNMPVTLYKAKKNTTQCGPASRQK